MDYAIDNSFYMKAKALLDKVEQNQRLQQLAMSNGIDVKNSTKLSDATKDNVATAVIALLLAKHNNDPRYNDLVRYGMDHRKTKIEIINDYKDQANQIITRAKNGNADELSGFTESYMEYDDSDIIQESQSILYEYAQIYQESEPSRFTKVTGYKDEKLIVRILAFIPRLISNIMDYIFKAFSDSKIKSYANKAAKLDKVTPEFNIALMVSEIQRAEPILRDAWDKLDGFTDLDDFLKRAESIKMDRDFVKFTDEDIEKAKEKSGYIRHRGADYDYQKDIKGKEMTGKQYSEYILKFKDIMSKMDPYLRNMQYMIKRVHQRVMARDPKYQVRTDVRLHGLNNILSYLNAVHNLVSSMYLNITYDLKTIDGKKNRPEFDSFTGNIKAADIKKYTNTMFDDSRVEKVILCHKDRFGDIFGDKIPMAFKTVNYGIFGIGVDEKLLRAWAILIRGDVDPEITSMLKKDKMMVITR